MSVLDRKLRRDLIGSAAMLLAVVGIMAVGIACYVSMGASYNNLRSAKRRYYAQCRMADFWIELKKVPVSELGPLRDLPGVVGIRPRIAFYTTVDVPGVLKPLNGLVLSLPDRRTRVINDIVLRRGTYFTGHRDNEVIVGEAFARRHGLRPGRWVRLILNNQLQDLYIVGTAISSEFVYLLQPGALAPDPEQFGVFYVKHSYAEEVFDFNGAANQVIGLLAPELRTRPRALLNSAERLLAPYGVFTSYGLEDQPSNRFLTQEIAGLKVFAYLLPAIFLAVAALVLNVLMRRVAEQQRTTIGTLKALGYSDVQVFLHFLKLAAVVSVFGTLAGCALGYWMAGGMTRMYRKFYEFPRLDNRFYPELIAVAALLSLLCAVAGSFHGVRAVLKLQPAQAMRPKPPRKGGAVLLERAAWFWRRLDSGWRMALRSLFRNRMRTAAGVFATAMGSAVLVSGLMMADATRFLVDFQFKWVLRSDYDLSFEEDRDASALDEAARLPGVDRAEPILTVPCTFVHGPYRRKGAITGIAPGATLTVPRNRRADPIPIPSTGVVLARKLAEVLHLREGDRLRIEPIKGLRRPRYVPVVRIADSYLGMQVYADIRYLSRLVGESLAVSGVQLAADADPRETAALYRHLKQLPSLQAVSARRAMVENLEKILVDNMGVFIRSLLFFSGTMFLGSIINSSLVSLAERQREVATLRVLGYSPWQVGMLLFRENMVVTMLGTVIGMPFGYLLAVITSMAYNTELFRFPVIAEPDTWVWAFLLAIVFGSVAQVFVQWRVHRMDWLEALQVKE